MARLNHGTLLENLVVLEVTRVVAADATTLEFAHAFAMPPLTEAWHKTKEEPGKNPRFNMATTKAFLTGTIAVGAPRSYSSFLLACLRNAPALPIVPYAGQPVHERGLCGPN